MEKGSILQWTSVNSGSYRVNYYRCHAQTLFPVKTIIFIMCITCKYWGFLFNSKRSTHSKHYHTHIHVKQPYIELSKEGFPVTTVPLHLCPCMYVSDVKLSTYFKNKDTVFICKVMKIGCFSLRCLFLVLFHNSICIRIDRLEMYHAYHISWCDTSLNHFCDIISTIWYLFPLI